MPRAATSPQITFQGGRTAAAAAVAIKEELTHAVVDMLTNLFCCAFSCATEEINARGIFLAQIELGIKMSLCNIILRVGFILLVFSSPNHLHF